MRFHLGCLSIVGIIAVLLVGVHRASGYMALFATGQLVSFFLFPDRDDSEES